MQWSTFVTIGSGALVGVLLTAFVLLPFALEAGTPLYQKRTAAAEACRAAGIELESLRMVPRFEFVDGCHAPRVTAVLNRPGQMIVTRMVKEFTATGMTKQRKAYSALMDGSGPDSWRMLHVQSAPNAVILEFSPSTLAESRP